MDVSENLLNLKWSRPETSEFPKIWKTFTAPDISSKVLVEYRIQDLPESRFEDAIEHMVANYLKDEPMTFALNGSNDEQHRADYTLAWRSVLAQKTVLVCFKAGSDEIVGVNFNFVNSKEDNFFNKFMDRCVSDITKRLFNVVLLTYRSFDPFEHYGVVNYLGSFGLSVDQKYRGRGVGVQLLEARKKFCEEFGLSLTHTAFSSNFSNKNADKAGFKTDVALSYQEVLESYPDFPISRTPSKEITIKSCLY